MNFISQVLKPARDTAAALAGIPTQHTAKAWCPRPVLPHLLALVHECSPRLSHDGAQLPLLSLLLCFTKCRLVESNEGGQDWLSA